MRHKLFLILALGLILVTSACTIRVERAETGEVITETLDVSAPDATSAELHLRFGAAHVTVGGGGEGLVSGTVAYNVQQLKPTVTVEGNVVRIEQINPSQVTLPPSGVRNDWELRLGNSVPLALVVEAGAYQGTWDLGGVPIQRLDVKEGAADSVYDFSEPNPAEMSELRIFTGASQVRLENLANANFERMVFNAGIGNYILQFGGELQRSGEVDIKTGASNVVIELPEGVEAKIVLSGGLSSMRVQGDFQPVANGYQTPGYANADARLDIKVNIGLGNLTLRMQ